MKCPACGMDSPPGAKWCDFCKEPFKTKAAPPPPPPAPAPPAQDPAVPKIKYLSPPAEPPKTVMAPGTSPGSVFPRPGPGKPVPSIPGLDLDPALLAKLPPGSIPIDTEKIPELPPWFRTAAYAFFGLVFVAGMALSGILYARWLNRDELAPAPQAPVSGEPNIP